MELAMSLKTLLTAAAFAVLGTEAALAAPVAAVQPQCSIMSVTVSTDCRTISGQGNDTAGLMNSNSVFTVTNWIFADRDETGSALIPPYNLDGYVDAKTGNWAVSSFNNYSFAALVLKAGSEAWVAYLLDLTKPLKLSGTWSTADIRNNGGNQPNLSHMSLYVGGQQIVPPPPSPVPLPAAGLLLMGAVGGLAALRRRKARA